MPGGERRRGRLSRLAAAALVAGLVLLGIGLAGQRHAPEPSAAAYGTIDATSTLQPSTHSPAPSTPASSASGQPVHPSPSVPDLPTTRPAPSTDALSPSRPVSITIPAIKVHSQVVPIGTTPDGTLAVPQPGPDLNKVAWYKNSPTPGQIGPAVLEGHVDTTHGPSVFFRLGAVRPGDTITITRADHATATFTVDAVRSYPSHHAFPRAEVFGGDVTQPVLRLITCTDFNHYTGHYVGNLVVFAHLTTTG